MPTIRHTIKARSDLLAIWLSIAADNPAAADRMFDRLEARVEILRQWPEIGVACPTIAADARMLVEQPYIILYRTDSDGIQIVRIVHGARDINSALFIQGFE